MLRVATATVARFHSLALSVAATTYMMATAPSATAAAAAASAATGTGTPVAALPPAAQPAIFISHGGGPSFFLRDAMMAEIGPDSATAAFLRRLPSLLPAPPKAILVLSAHWEEAPVRVQSGAAPGLLFDYYGFPRETYALKFPATGAPDVAARVIALLGAAGIAAEPDAKRAYDHGTFVPLLVAYPKADVPVLQLSLHPSLDPELHLRMGVALAPLRKEGVLILGSGAMTHNLREMGAPGAPPARWAAEFTAAMHGGLTADDPKTRIATLTGIKGLPHFKQAHPREEHLIPLLVVAGAGTPGLVVGAGGKLGWAASSTTAVAVGAAGDASSSSAAGGGRVERIHDAWAMGAFSQAAYRFE